MESRQIERLGNKLGISVKVQINKSIKGFWTSTFNFTTILRAAFTHPDPKSAKKTVKSSSFLCFWDLRALKAASKQVDEIDI